MFYELRASSRIQIPCHEFTGGIPKQTDENKQQIREASHGNLVKEVMKHLLVQYCNKVIPPTHGLCVTVSAIDEIGDARIYPEDGSTYVEVEYRLILFKPYNCEVIEGSIANSDGSGIRISLGFFEQVFIAKQNLPQPSQFDEVSKTWIYSTENADLKFEKNDIIHLKVIKTHFKAMNKGRKVEKKEDNDEEEEKVELLEERLLKRPMVVYGTLDGQGLGPSTWWE